MDSIELRNGLSAMVTTELNKTNASLLFMEHQMILPMDFRLDYVQDTSEDELEVQVKSLRKHVEYLKQMLLAMELQNWNSL